MSSNGGTLGQGHDRRVGVVDRVAPLSRLVDAERAVGCLGFHRVGESVVINIHRIDIAGSGHHREGRDRSHPILGGGSFVDVGDGDNNRGGSRGVIRRIRRCDHQGDGAILGGLVIKAHASLQLEKRGSADNFNLEVRVVNRER